MAGRDQGPGTRDQATEGCGVKVVRYDMSHCVGCGPSSDMTCHPAVLACASRMVAVPPFSWGAGVQVGCMYDDDMAYHTTQVSK